jgi:hypothetical protein
MSRATRYSAEDYTFLLAGQKVDSGRGQDTFLTIAQQEDSVTYSVGLDREGVFNFIPGRPVLVTLTLMQTSTANALLTELHNASDAAGGLLYPCAGQDSRGTSKIVSDACAITKLPDEGFGKESGTVDWAIIVHNPLRTVGSK